MSDPTASITNYLPLRTPPDSVALRNHPSMYLREMPGITGCRPDRAVPKRPDSPKPAGKRDHTMVTGR